MKCGSLAMALAACGVCNPAPPARHWFRADQVDSSRVTLGNTVRARLESIPTEDGLGRRAHVRAIALVATVDIVVPGATNDAITAHTIRSIWQNITLEDVAGHKYYPGLDGRVLLDDHYFRFWRNLPLPFISQALGLQFGVQGQNRPTISTDNGLAVNAGAATYTRNATLYMPLARPLGMQGSPFQGLIPLKMLTMRGPDAFRFKIASTFATSPAGITAASTQLKDLAGVAGMEIWVEIVYLPGYAIDAPYVLEQYELREKSGRFLHHDKTTENLWIRYFAEDASEGGFAGQNKAEDHEGVTLDVNGCQELGAFTNVQLTQRMLFEECEQVDAALAHNNAAMYLPTVGSAGPLAMMLFGQRSRDVAPRGPINFKYATRNATFTRYIHRAVECVKPDRAKDIASALDCDPCKVLGTDSKGNVFDPKASGCKIDGTQPTFVLPRGSTKLSRGYGA